MPRHACRNCGRTIDGDSVRCPECGVHGPLPMGPKTGEFAGYLVAAAIILEFLFLIVLAVRLWPM